MADGVEERSCQVIGGLGRLLRETLSFVHPVDDVVNGALFLKGGTRNLDLSYRDALDAGSGCESAVPFAREDVCEVVRV